MNKLGAFSGLKSLERFKSTKSSYTFPSSRPSSTSDSSTSGSFANLKLTAEKLVKEQASVKTDLDIAKSKLNKSTEHVRVLEEKLQTAFNENAKLNVKQKEDEKLWKGLESKFSSTKTLCDQLTEILQHLAAQVQDAEKDKEYFEGKLTANCAAIDDLNQKMNGLSLKLESAEDTVRIRETELKELHKEKNQREELHRDEQCRTSKLFEEKDAMIKQLEAVLSASKLDLEKLSSKLAEVNVELRLKEDELNGLLSSLENMEKEKSVFLANNEDFARKLDSSSEEIRNLKRFVQVLADKLVELDEQSLILFEKFMQLNSVYDSCFKLLRNESHLAAAMAKRRYDEVYNRLLDTISEKDASQLLIQQLNEKVIELQKVQESTIKKHAEECHLAEDKIQNLESEVKVLFSKKNESEILIEELEQKITDLSSSLTMSEQRMHELEMKVSEVESESKCTREELQEEIQKKEDGMDILKKEIARHEQDEESLVKQVSHIQNMLEEKEQLILQHRDEQRELENQNAEIQASLAATENKLIEAKKQYDVMLESKQLELSRHLKEISQKNDQAINDIRKKYEVEKQEIITHEKEKVDKVITELEKKSDKKLAEFQEESRQHILKIQEGHNALVLRIEQEHARKESNLTMEHSKEIKHIQLQAENELREKTRLLRDEHEVQVRDLKNQHEEECEKLEEELDLQKSKEARQRALLQLQWKVMGDKPKEEQEVNSKKEYSISSIKMGKSDAARKSQLILMRADDEKKDSPYLRATQTPVSNLLKKSEGMNTGSVMSIPKNSKKVTHSEYEVEMSNGRTITKRKTKSTVMFGEPRKHRKMNSPKPVTPRNVKAIKAGSQPHHSNIGDLFSEGSLNPYADDPYAFD